MIASPLGVFACPSNSNCPSTSGGGSSGGSSTDAGLGGPVVGPIDNHCFFNVADGGGVISPDAGGAAEDAGFPFWAQPVQWFACPLDDAGVCILPLYPDGGGDGGPCPPYGPTNYNTQANDDDCKYDVGWWSTPILYNPGGSSATCDTGPCVTFYVTNHYMANGAPMTGNPNPSAGNNLVRLEIESESGNGLPPANINVSGGAMTQIQPGVYKSAPLTLNVHGQWLIRFHFNEECVDSWASSPHGHAAFYINVP